MSYKITLYYFDAGLRKVFEDSSDATTLSQRLVGIQFVKNVLHEDKIDDAFVLLVLENQVRIRKLRSLIKIKN